MCATVLKRPNFLTRDLPGLQHPFTLPSANRVNAAPVPPSCLLPKHRPKVISCSSPASCGVRIRPHHRHDDDEGRGNEDEQPPGMPSRCSCTPPTSCIPARSTTSPSSSSFLHEFPISGIGKNFSRTHDTEADDIALPDV